MAEDADIGAFPGLTPTDRENLAGGDDNFKPHNWEDLKDIISSIPFMSFEYGLSDSIPFAVSQRPTTSQS